MTGLLDLYADQGGPSGPALVQTPSTPGERFGASWDAALHDPTRYFNIDQRRNELWQDVTDKLSQATGEKLTAPGAYYPTPEEFKEYGVHDTPERRAARERSIVDRYRALQTDSGVSADLPNPETIEQQIADEGRAVQQKAGALVGTGNGFAGFVGGMVAPTPENIAGALIPPARAVFGASAVGNSFLRSLGREALYQAGTQAALNVTATTLDQAARREFKPGEIVDSAVEGAAGGALLGGAFHTVFHGPKALYERWAALPEKVRENAPLEVKDAMGVVQTDSLYSASNRLGLPWDLHERYQGRALDAVMRGRMPDLGELKPGDTPMTGLATILQSAPETIRAEGLGNLIPRIASLPDQELESLGRQLKPETFAPLDAIDAKLKALDERTAAIHQEAQQIGLADVADIDTAARLQDVEAQLQKKGLRKAARADLERERDMITQSIDPQGQLTEELKKTRKDFFPQHGEDLKAIDAERASLMQQREAAQSVVSRETEAMRKRLDALDAGRQFGEDVSPEALAKEFGKPEDVAKALQAADFERQIRMVRETAPARTEAPAPKVNTDAVPMERPEIEAAAMAVMEGKGGALADFRKAVAKELEAHEIEAADAKAALSCVNGGGGLP